MTQEEYRQVYAPVPFDGLLWHAVHRFDEDRDLVETCCGEVYKISEIEVSEIGETPRGLSGSTICYRCTSSHAQPAEKEASA